MDFSVSPKSKQRPIKLQENSTFAAKSRCHVILIFYLRDFFMKKNRKELLSNRRKRMQPRIRMQISWTAESGVRVTRMIGKVLLINVSHSQWTRAFGVQNSHVIWVTFLIARVPTFIFNTKWSSVSRFVGSHMPTG